MKTGVIEISENFTCYILSPGKSTMALEKNNSYDSLKSTTIKIPLRSEAFKIELDGRTISQS